MRATLRTITARYGACPGAFATEHGWAEGAVAGRLLIEATGRR